MAYVLTVEGNFEGVESRVKSLPYVSAVSTKIENGTAHLVITVEDETKAKSDLLRSVLSDKSVTITEFGRRKYELEEVFLRLVEEKKDAE